MFGIGIQEMAFLAVIALLVFGPKRLPELARTLGRGMAEFRRASADLRGALSLEPDQPSVAPRRRDDETRDPREDRDLPHAPAQAVGGPDPATEDSVQAVGGPDPATEAAIQAELADESNDERHRDEARSAAEPAAVEADSEESGAGDEPDRSGRHD